MLKQSYEVEVLVNGKPAKEYQHEGKIYIEGREGTPFSIRIRNNTYGRKLCVPTIDGISVLDGEEGNYNSRGYIVQGRSSITIDGWRTSDKDVATFFFSSPENSYRKRMNRGDNLGIIGVAVFDEISHIQSPNPLPVWPTPTYPKYPINPYPYPYPVVYMNAADSGCSSTYNAAGGGSMGQTVRCCLSNNPGVEQKLGTGWGESKHSEVTTVDFERVQTPETTFEIYYNTREELEKDGINFRKEPLYVTPQAFPGRYCRPPQN